MKICIIGPSGSGKTYLAKALAKKLDIPHTNLDYVFFRHVVGKSWVELSEKEWRKNLQKVLKQRNWIIEGVNCYLCSFVNSPKNQFH